MDRPWSNLRVFAAETPFPATTGALPERTISATLTAPTFSQPDSTVLANRELIRSVENRRTAAGLVPYSAAWYDELEHNRYQWHGVWLSSALELGRHPGESLLLLGAGLGSDATRYIQTGTPG